MSCNDSCCRFICIIAKPTIETYTLRRAAWSIFDGRVQIPVLLEFFLSDQRHSTDGLMICNASCNYRVLHKHASRWDMVFKAPYCEWKHQRNDEHPHGYFMVAPVERGSHRQPQQYQ